MSIAEFGPAQKEALVPHPDRVDVHHHLIPPFWAKALPSHDGDFRYAPAAVGASFTAKLEAFDGVTLRTRTAINNTSARALFASRFSMDARFGHFSEPERSQGTAGAR